MRESKKMIASELITELQKAMEKYGDRRVLIDGWDIAYVQHRWGQILIESDPEE